MIVTFREPTLDIKRSKGLSDTQIRKLLDELKCLCSSLKGEVMIFEIAQHVQVNKQPPWKANKFANFPKHSYYIVLIFNTKLI